MAHKSETQRPRTHERGHRHHRSIHDNNFQSTYAGDFKGKQNQNKRDETKEAIMQKFSN